ncbi:CC138 protein, partial [Horornis vulcanius]|nr:CC138 protein [Horornis vulcanius]
QLLPIATEQLQWMPYVNPKLHVPVIKFIYWSIRQIDTDIQQHAKMRSTMRRLGKDIFKGIVSKGNPHSSSEQSTESKSKSAAFFKSFCMPLRFLSFIACILIFSVDYLAQAFESLRVDLKTDEGKALFLEYQCVPVILSHLKVSSTSLLSSALDGLLQMTMESG